MTNDTTNLLRHLIRANIDSARGLERSAAVVEREPFARLFRQIARDRLGCADRLRALVSRAAGSAPRSGTIGGCLHRGWLNMREAVSGVDDDIVLIEAERAEAVLERRYRAGIPAVHGVDIRRLLDDQYEQVRQMHCVVRSLRDMVAHEGGRTWTGALGRARRADLERFTDLPARAASRTPRKRVPAG